MKTKQLLDSEKKDAVFQASIEFIGTLTGMKPPPIETAPPETFAPFRAFTERVCEIFAALEADIAKLVEPIAIAWPEYNHEAMGCGLEDSNITDRYDAMRYGWDEAMDRVAESLPKDSYITPQAPAATGWMPIETAPKDGVIDISTASGRVPDCFWGKPTYGSEYGFVFNSGDDCDGPVVELVREPLHWMPLPAAPGGAA